MKNPFEPRYPILEPNRLVGRQKAISTLQSRLSKGNVLLLGGYRTGRSSMLRCLEKLGSDRLDESWVYVSGQSVKPGDGLAQLFSKYGLDSLENKLAAGEIKKIVLLFDEFESLTGKDGRFTLIDFDNLRSTLQNFGRRFVTLASVPRMPETKQLHGSPLLNTFLPWKLPALEVECPSVFYREFIAVTGDEALMSVAEERGELLDRAGRLAGLNPWLLQLFGHLAWEAQNQEDFPGVGQDQAYRWAKKVIEQELSRERRFEFYLHARAVAESSPTSWNAPEDSLRHWQTLGLCSSNIVPGVVTWAIDDWWSTCGDDDSLASRISRETLDEVAAKLDGNGLTAALDDPYFMQALLRGKVGIHGDTIQKIGR